MNLSIEFGFVPVASSISSISQEDIARTIQNVLIASGGLRLKNDEINLNIPVVFLVLTGGTEQKILDLYAERKKVYKNEPLFLIAHSSNNSLPASLETLAKLQQDGDNGKIIYINSGSNDELNRYLKYMLVYHKLLNTRIGLIGEPSDWLAASMPDFEVIKNLWGPEVDKIAIAELIDKIKNADEKEAAANYKELLNNASAVKEPSENELMEASKVYQAVRDIVKSHGFNAVTVRCFDLVIGMENTGCFALSKMNDDGIAAGCEGDLVSVLGMLWLNYFTGEPVWMANPAQLNTKDDSLWLAHCTAPLSMVERYKLRSHFESGLGLGIQGHFPKGPVTLVRIGGKKLDKIWIAGGELIECGEDENLCRTQARIKLRKPAKVSDLLNEPLGNHMLMVKGNVADELKEWWDIFINRKINNDPNYQNVF